MQSSSAHIRYVKDCFLIGRTTTLGFWEKLSSLPVLDAVMTAAANDKFLLRAIQESGLENQLRKAHANGGWNTQCEQLSLPLE